MNDAAERRAYLVLVRIFLSYTRRISGEGKRDTTLELAGLASCRQAHKSKRGQSIKTAPSNYATANQLFLAAFILAQRAFCAAAILARPAALILPFLFTGLVLATGAGAPRIADSSFSSLATFSLRLAAWRSCDGVS